MDENEVGTTGITRRTALQRVGLAGAAIWAAPVVTGSLPSAMAQASPRCGTDFVCGDVHAICGASGPFNQCLCDQDADNQTGCWEDEFCNNLLVCATNADCPPGSRCYPTTCCDTPVCIFDCGTTVNGANAQTVGSGQRASGL